MWGLQLIATRVKLRGISVRSFTTDWNSTYVPRLAGHLRCRCAIILLINYTTSLVEGCSRHMAVLETPLSPHVKSSVATIEKRHE